MARRRIRRIPGDRVQEQIGVVRSRDVEVNHLLDMPRLRQPERHRELARGQRRRDLPARMRRLELVKRAGIFRGEERDVPLGSEPVQSAADAQRRNRRPVHAGDDVAAVQQQRRPGAVRVRERAGEPRFGDGGVRCTELDDRLLDVGRQLAKQDAIGLRQVPRGDSGRRTGSRLTRRVDDGAIADHRPEPAPAGAAHVVPQRAGHTAEPHVDVPEFSADDRLDEQAPPRRIGDEVGVGNLGEHTAGHLVDLTIASDVQPRNAPVIGPGEAGTGKPDHRIRLDCLEQGPHGGS